MYKLNDDIQAKIPGELITITSITRLCPTDELRGLQVDLADGMVENLESLTPSGMPLHELKIKVGSIVMLLQNIDPRGGLVNGTRLQVIEIRKNFIKCRILTGSKGENRDWKNPKTDPAIVMVFRTHFQYGGTAKQQGFKWERFQFPLAVCFAMTINKAQGQTLGRVALALNESECFGHGQLYVAFSRVRKMECIKVLCYRGSDGRSSTKNMIRNIVYDPIIDEEDLNDPALQKYREMKIMPLPKSFKPLPDSGRKRQSKDENQGPRAKKPSISEESQTITIERSPTIALPSQPAINVKGQSKVNNFIKV